MTTFSPKIPEMKLPSQLQLPSSQFQPPLKPFLRWAGGKSRITGLLAAYTPKTYNRYWEPFLGSAAMFFYLHPEKAFLSDNNSALVDCYNQVRDNPEKIYEKLKEHTKKNSEEHYYSVRDLYNKSKPSISQSARFIYLNKTNFNGIFRVNTKGEYNVPYGHKKSLALPSYENFLEISDLLKKADIRHQPFENIENNNLIKENDFIYFDPPYPPLTATAYFTHYTSERFLWADQERVAELANELAEKGCHVMISNSDVEQIRKLYRGWNFHELPVVRWIAANGKRHKVKEVIITSYKVLQGKEK